jgi:hypothetical protein
MANNNTTPEQASLTSGNGAATETRAPAKTTPDEGKTFDEDMEFECVQNCYLDMVRYRPGAVKTGRKCPPFFEVRGKAPKADG